MFTVDAASNLSCTLRVSSLDFDEGRRKGLNPAHFEGLEGEVHICFMDAAQMEIENPVEGGEGDSVMIPVRL